MEIDVSAILLKLYRGDAAKYFDDPAMGALFDPPLIGVASADDAWFCPIQRVDWLLPLDAPGGVGAGRARRGGPQRRQLVSARCGSCPPEQSWRATDSFPELGLCPHVRRVHSPMSVTAIGGVTRTAVSSNNTRAGSQYGHSSKVLCRVTLAMTPHVWPTEKSPHATASMRAHPPKRSGIGSPRKKTLGHREET
jgi:hypothetical protein